MKDRKRERFLLFAVLVFLLGSASACGSRPPKARLSFDCAQVVNDGLLLSVDLIWVNESEKREVLNIGPDNWWTDAYRNSMVMPQLEKLTLRGKCQSFTVDTVGRPGDTYLIVFADYRDEDSSIDDRRIVVPAGYTVTITAYSGRLGCTGCDG